MNFIDPWGLCAESDSETWTAVEYLAMAGVDARIVDTGFTYQKGVAYVTFSNGDDKFSAMYSVTSTQTVGVNISLGVSISGTTYTMDFPKGTKPEDIKESFEGDFVTYSLADVGVMIGRTVTREVDRTFPNTMRAEPNAWAGNTGGGSFGPSYSKPGSAQVSNYRLMK